MAKLLVNTLLFQLGWFACVFAGDSLWLLIVAAVLAVHLLWMTSFSGMEKIYDMITTNAARAMGIKNHVLEPGGSADLVVLKAEDVYHAIWDHEPPAYVIRNGKNVTLG